MSNFDHSRASLRIMGDTLDPDWVTAQLGIAPTESFRKGDVRIGKSTGNQMIRRTSGWYLTAPNATPEDLNGQIRSILSETPDDPDLWQNLNQRFQAELFCGLFMATWNDGITLAPDVLLMAGRRGLAIGLDVYRSDDEDTTAAS
jgi:hypothetical protein